MPPARASRRIDGLLDDPHATEANNWRAGSLRSLLNRSMGYRRNTQVLAPAMLGGGHECESERTLGPPKKAMDTNIHAHVCTSTPAHTCILHAHAKQKKTIRCEQVHISSCWKAPPQGLDVVRELKRAEAPRREPEKQVPRARGEHSAADVDGLRTRAAFAPSLLLPVSQACGTVGTRWSTSQHIATNSTSSGVRVSAT